MKVTANIATYPAREDSLKKILPHVIKQFDEVRVCLNGYEKVPEWLTNMKVDFFHIPKEDLTDNGKFLPLDLIDGDEIYCSMDDDIIYPPDYREAIEKAIQKYPGKIVTFHGRTLVGKRLKYYRGGHKSYRCKDRVIEEKEIDVAGTGVTAFDTSVFKPDKIHLSKMKKMSDLVFSLEAARKGIPIQIIAHKSRWIKTVDNETTIHGELVNDDLYQAILANKIYELRR